MKLFVLAGIGFLAFVFAAAGSGTAFATMEQGGMKASFTLFHMRMCGGGSCATASYDSDSGGCNSARQAAAAFVIISVLILLPATAVPLATLKITALKRFLIVPFGAAAFTLLISFPITIALYSSIDCGNGKISDIDGASIGPSGILQLVAWLLALGGIGAAFALPDPPESKGPGGSNNVSTMGVGLL